MVTNELTRAGALLADPTRAEILAALMDGRAFTASELARDVGCDPSTTIEHLTELLDVGLVAVERQAGHRYHRLAGPEIARLLESLGVPRDADGPPIPRIPASLAYTRTCYDHLAGPLAVAIFERLLGEGHLCEADHPILEISPTGAALLEGLGVDIAALDRTSRPRARRCLDRTQRRHHLAGALGAHLLDLMLERRWIVRGSHPRSIRVTTAGRSEIPRWLVPLPG